MIRSGNIGEKRKDLELFQKKYRETFNDFFGSKNQPTIKSLKSLIEAPTKPAFYMFYGPSGCGKNTLAKILANHLASEGNFIRKYTDYTLSMKSVTDQILLNLKVGFIDVFILNEPQHADKAFQNGMLQIFEKPTPGKFVIFCTTAPKKLAPQFRTRSKHYEVFPLSDGEIVSLLKSVCKKEKVPIKKAVLKEITKTSGGVPGRALNHLQSVMNIEIEKND